MGETYASYDLVDVRRWIRAWIHQRIQTLDSELRASKAQQTCIRGREEPEGDSEVVQLHPDLVAKKVTQYSKSGLRLGSCSGDLLTSYHLYSVRYECPGNLQQLPSTPLGSPHIVIRR
jgi:hypothetical protein